MILGKKIVVVLPAYNAARTIEMTYKEIPMDIVDEVVLVDDLSHDDTIEEARKLNIHHIIRHEKNLGYGGNQKTCYNKACDLGADLVIMLHPDYQYSPRLIHSIAYLIAHEVFPVVLGSRILGKGALKGGMPLYKYVCNRVLTFFQNILMNQKLSEYHTGYRAFSRDILEAIPYEHNSDDFIFDNQMLAQISYKGFPIGEITCPTRYFKGCSSINLKRSLVYGFGVLKVSFQYRMAKWGVFKPAYLNFVENGGLLKK